MAESVHTFPEEERIGFVDYINTLLKDDQDLKDQNLIPLDPKTEVIFKAVASGLLLAKLIHSIAPGSIDLKKINKKPNLNTFNCNANLNVVLAAAKDIGVQITNISAEDLISGTPHLVLGIVWQILRTGLETTMKKNIETLGLTGYAGIKSPLEILLKWVSDSITRAGSKKIIKNLQADISDSEAYAYLFNSMDPNFDPKEVLAEKDHEKRALKILEVAEKLGLRKFLAPHDIVSGASRLNFAFVANLFNHAKHVKSNPTPRTLVPDSKASNSDLLAIIEKLTKENEHLKEENLKLKSLLSDSDKLREKLIQLEKSSADADAESKKLRERLVALEKRKY